MLTKQALPTLRSGGDRCRDTPEAPARPVTPMTDRPIETSAWSLGQRIALVGLGTQFLLSIVLFFASGMVERSPVQGILALAVGLGVSALLAWGIVRRSRLAYGLGIAIAASQAVAWTTFASDNPTFLVAPPLGWLLVAAGLLLSWGEAWNRPA